MTSALVFDELWEVICERACADPGKKSYVRHLLFHEKGIDKPLEKVGEESPCDFVLAVKNGREEAIVGGAGDYGVDAEAVRYESDGSSSGEGGNGTF